LASAPRTTAAAVKAKIDPDTSDISTRPADRTSTRRSRSAICTTQSAKATPFADGNEAPVSKKSAAGDFFPIY
jgi:hypothetical protein